MVTQSDPTSPVASPVLVNNNAAKITLPLVKDPELNLP